MQIKSLYKAQLGTTEVDLYPVPINKTAIIKGIRLVNTSSASVTVNLFVRRATGGTSYRILPKDVTLAPSAALVDDSEITLEGLTTLGGEDRVRGLASAATAIDCVISGVERDA